MTPASFPISHYIELDGAKYLFRKKTRSFDWRQVRKNSEWRLKVAYDRCCWNEANGVGLEAFKLAWEQFTEKPLLAFLAKYPCSGDDK